MAHIKDKKITILYHNEGTNENGFPVDKWDPIKNGENIWAYFRHLSGKEFFEAATTNTKVEVIFEINWRNDIDTYMQIRYKGKDYSITRIDNFEGYKDNLKIYACAVN